MANNKEAHDNRIKGAVGNKRGKIPKNELVLVISSAIIHLHEESLREPLLHGGINLGLRQLL
jgi:hypothetical protein